MTNLEQQVWLAILAVGALAPVQEYKFNPDRKWRFDFAWPAQRVALEVEGGIWMKGRHVRARGYEADCEKYNEAALSGWTVLRVAGHQTTDIEYLAGLLKRAGLIEPMDAPVHEEVWDG